jgi:hypothetical protein
MILSLSPVFLTLSTTKMGRYKKKKGSYWGIPAKKPKPSKDA